MNDKVALATVYNRRVIKRAGRIGVQCVVAEIGLRCRVRGQRTTGAGFVDCIIGKIVLESVVLDFRSSLYSNLAGTEYVAAFLFS